MHVRSVLFIIIGLDTVSEPVGDTKYNLVTFSIFLLFKIHIHTCRHIYVYVYTHMHMQTLIYVVYISTHAHTSCFQFSRSKISELQVPRLPTCPKTPL